MPIRSTGAGHLLHALGRGYDALGFSAAAEHDEVFKALVVARIIEPTSRLDSLRVLEEAGAAVPSYATVNDGCGCMRRDPRPQALARGRWGGGRDRR